MLDNLMIWGLWLTIALSLLIIVCGAFIKRNLRGFRPDKRWRLTYILIGIGSLLSSSSLLLIQVGRSTWPTVDRHILSWIEGIFIILSLAMGLAAIRILARRQDQLLNRARAVRRQA
jgi:hypothetical protein